MSVTMLSLMIILALSALLASAVLLLRRRAVVVQVPAQLESIRRLASLLVQITGEAELDEQAVFHCRLALDEACTNIIEHSYANDPGGAIRAEFFAERGRCAIHLTDYGKPYDPAAIRPPRKGSSLDDMMPGGLGLHIMRSVMDEVSYTPSPSGNRLVMIKRNQPSHFS